MDPYQYEPLDPAQPTIRLLRLLQYRREEIECEIYHASLDDENVSYEALSYCWGSYELSECIKLNGKDHWITESLHTALRHLRLPDHERILWIDALCIHQADKVEQGHQVRQMGQIFSRADLVNFWLGSSSFEIRCLLESSNHLQEELNVPGQLRDNDHVEKAWLGVLGKHSNRITGEILQDGLHQLLSRPWFKGVWIVQEVAMAQRGLLHCGASFIPAEHFHLCLQLPGFDSASVPDHAKAILEVMPGRRDMVDSWWLQSRSLPIIIKKFAASEASNARERGYGLLSLTSDARDVTKDLPIDYTKSIDEVYRDALLLIPTRQNISWEILGTIIGDLDMDALLLSGLPKVSLSG